MMCHQNSGQCQSYASEGVWTWLISIGSMNWTRSGEESGSVAAQGRSSLRSSCLVIFFGFKPTFRIPSSKRRVSEWEQYFCCKLWCSWVDVRAPTREYWCASVTNLRSHASVATGHVLFNVLWLKSTDFWWRGPSLTNYPVHWNLGASHETCCGTTLDWSH